MTRWFFLPLFCLMLSGCGLPMAKMTNLSTGEETRLFAQGLDEYLASGDLTNLKLLSQKYPPGEWRTKAEGILAMAEQQRLQQTQLKKSEKELADYKKEMDSLIQDKLLLEGTLKRLKEALIDTELRAK